MNTYCCYTLLRNNTQAIVVSDTVIFRHHTLYLSFLTAEDRIIHCLRAITTDIRANRSPARTDKQLLAIERIQSIFSNLQHPPAIEWQTTAPSASASAPRVITPASTSRVSAWPQQLPRVPREPPTTTTTPPMLALRLQSPSDTQPIALHTQSHGVALSLIPHPSEIITNNNINGKIITRSNNAGKIIASNNITDKKNTRSNNAGKLIARNNITGEINTRSNNAGTIITRNNITGEINTKNNNSGNIITGNNIVARQHDTSSRPTLITPAHPPKPIKPQKVSFILPRNHLDKYSEAYRHLTPARLQLAGENTQWKQSPVIKNWRERSCSKVQAITLPTTLHNNQFALLADEDKENKDKPLDFAFSVLNHATSKTLEHRQLQKHPAYKETWDKSYANELG